MVRHGMALVGNNFIMSLRGLLTVGTCAAVLATPLAFAPQALAGDHNTLNPKAAETLAESPNPEVGETVTSGDTTLVTAFKTDADGGGSVITREVPTENVTTVVNRLEDRNNISNATVATKYGLLATNDEYSNTQASLTTQQFPAAWSMATGTNTVVAVIDTGVDATHPDLAGQLLPSIDFSSARSSNPVDTHGHGTHVAGIIAAKRDNGIGIAGAAPNAKILPLKVFEADGTAYSSAIAEAITYAANQGVEVINMSLGSDVPDQVIRDAIAYALGKGVIVIAAAGNSGHLGSPAMYPAAWDEVIAVGAMDPEGQNVAYFSNRGSYLDIAAAGEDVPSTVPGGYQYMSGTSMAAPFVAAAAALIDEKTPGLSQTQVLNALAITARDAGAPGKDVDSGWGFLQVAHALSAGATVDQPLPEPDDNTPPTATVPATPGKVTIKQKGKKVTVKWGKVTDATSYRIRWNKKPNKSTPLVAYKNVNGSKTSYSFKPKKGKLWVQVDAGNTAGWSTSTKFYKARVK